LLQRALSRVDRTTSIVLALIWLAAGASGLVLGLAYASWKLLLASVFALAFGAMWSVVAWRGRLLGAGTDRSATTQSMKASNKIRPQLQG
jgi:hypothetical protein